MSHSTPTVQLTLRVPELLIDRLDQLAASGGLTRAQMLRMVLSRVSEADLPTGLVENAALLREANGVA